MEKESIRLEPFAGEDGADDPPLIPPDDNEHRVMFCRSCDIPRVFNRRKTRHRLHFCLSLGTLGGWLPFWGAIILFQRFKPWTCSVCRAHQRNQ